MILENRNGQIVGIDANGNEVPVQLGPSVIEEQLGIPVYSDDANAPSGTQYFSDTDSAIKYKDSDGTVHTSGGTGGGDVSNPMQGDLDANGNAIDNVGSLNAGEATIGENNPIDFGSEADLSLEVPADFGTIQEAVEAAPLRPGELVDIRIDEGTYDEDVFISPRICGEQVSGPSDSSEAPNGKIRLVSDGNKSGTRDNVQIKSITASNLTGTNALSVGQLTIYGESPYDNESGMITVYEGMVRIDDVRFSPDTADSSKAVVAYGSDVVNVTPIFESNLQSQGVAKSIGTLKTSNPTYPGGDVYNAYVGTPGSSHIVEGDTTGTIKHTGQWIRVDGDVVEHGMGEWNDVSVLSLSGPQDLSTIDPPSNFVIAIDDGTNTPVTGTPCVYQSGEWKYPDSISTFNTS